MEPWDRTGEGKNILGEKAGHFVPAAAQRLSGVLHDICNSAFRMARRQSGDRNPHLLGPSLTGMNEIVICQRAEQPADRPIQFKLWELDRIPAGDERKLMNCSVRSNNFPSGRSYEPVNLREEEYLVQRLRRLQARMPYGSVNQIEAHEIEIIRSSEVKRAARSADTVHFAHGRARVRNVLYGFARYDHIE